jgi:hypothetical protein
MRTETVCVQYQLKGKHKEQDASINFVDGRFTKCDYHVTNISYQEEDWEWLGFLAAKIKEFSEAEAKRFAEIRKLEV